MSTSSPAQIAANRDNAKKSTGPRETSSTRWNAMKHGLTSQGITELDDHEAFERFLAGVRTSCQPIGVIEDELCRRVAVDLLRGQRALMLEAEEITAQLNPPKYKKTLTVWSELDTTPQAEIIELVDPGIPSRMSMEGIERLLRTPQRYETAIANSLTRNLNNLHRVQKERRQRDAVAAS